MGLEGEGERGRGGDEMSLVHLWISAWIGTLNRWGGGGRKGEKGGELMGEGRYEMGPPTDQYQGQGAGSIILFKFIMPSPRSAKTSS